MSQIFITDLSKLPAPQVIETPDVDTILSEILTDFAARMKDSGQTHTAIVESDPLYKLAEAVAYREIVVRQRVNDAAKAVMLPYATGGDLDTLAANIGIARLMIQAGDTTQTPPVNAVYESDSDLRTRVIASLWGRSCAGPTGAYYFYAMSADGQVADVSVTSPEPAEVKIYVLSRKGRGEAADALLKSVALAVSGDDVRPVGDRVTVASAEIVPYAVMARLHLGGGPGAEPVINTAKAQITALTQSLRRIGKPIALSAIYAALSVEGVARVELLSPKSDTILSEGQAAYCESIDVQTVI